MTRDLLLYTLVYPPDGVSTAQILGELAEDLAARDVRVRVVTTVPTYRRGEAEGSDIVLRRRPPGLWSTSRQGDVEVWHVTAPSGTSRLARLTTWALIHTVGAVLAFAVARRGSVYLVPSPLLSMGLVGAAVARLRRGSLVYNAQELHPDVAIELGYVRSGVLISALRLLERAVYRAAHTVTTISRGMAARIRSREESAHVEMIPNFVDLEDLRPVPADNDFAREHDLVGAPVISYAGVMGPAQGLDALLDLAAAFPREAGVRTLLIGEGRSRDALRRRADREAIPGVGFLDYQPYARIPEIYAASDLCVVALASDVSLSALPSKVLRIMACGRPLLALCATDSELAREVEAAGAGLVLDPAETARRADDVLALLRNEGARAEMGERGRAWVVARYAREAVAERYRALIEEASTT